MRPIRPVAHRGVLVAVLTCAVACGGGEYDFPVEVEVLSTEGGPVEGAVLLMNGEQIGRTDGNGKFKGSHHGEVEQEAILQVKPPSEYKLGPEGGQLKVVLGTQETEEGEAPQTLAFKTTLAPTKLDFVVLVAAEGRFRPIWVGEEQVGRTNSRGVAALHLRAEPNESVTVKIDPRGRKEKPLAKEFTLGESERILQVSDQDVVEETEQDVEERKERTEKVVRRERKERQDYSGGGGGGGGGGRRYEEPPPPPMAPVGGGGEPTADEAKAAKGAAKAAKAAAKAAKAAAKAAKSSAGKVAKTLKKFPGAREVEEANLAASEASNQAKRAGKAAGDAATAARAKDRYEAESKAQEAEDALRRAEEEAARAAQLVADAKRTMTEERDRLEAEAREAEARLDSDREKWAADCQSAADAAKRAADDAKKAAADAKARAKKAKKDKKGAKAGAKAAARAAKKAAKAAKGLAKLPGKAKKAGVGKGQELVTRCEDGQRAAEAEAGAAKEALAQVDAALEADGVAPPPPDDVPGGAVASLVDDKKKKKKDKKRKDKKPGAEEAVDCTLDVVEEAVEAGDMPKPLLKSCGKLAVGSPGYPEINLKVAQYFHRKKRRKAECKALSNATKMGQYKYDPMVLFSLMKCLLLIKQYRKAVEVKDRLLQVKDRMPADVRKKKICEMYMLFAQGYEQLFYKEHGEDPDGDHLPLLEKAIDMWERNISYCGADTKAKKAIGDLKKMKEELIQ